MDRTDIHERDLMRMRGMAGLLFAGGLAAGLGGGWQRVRQSRDGTDPYSRLETSGPSGPALCMAAGDLGDNDQTPLVAASCQGFGNAAEILELG